MTPTTEFSKMLASREITSADLAEKLRVSRKTVESWRSGARRPGSEWTRLKLSTLLGISARKLAGMFSHN